MEGRPTYVVNITRQQTAFIISQVKHRLYRRITRLIAYGAQHLDHVEQESKYGSDLSLMDGESVSRESITSRSTVALPLGAIAETKRILLI
ncbi:hypothetical protein WAI453_001901 [Rhynchosporium graminicola]